MTSRGEASGLLYGFIVAFASGIAVVVAISMGGVNAIVGTAISASLLPPIVNSGLCLAMALKIRIAGENSKDSSDYAVLGIVSFSLFLLNFIVIVLTGFFTFRFVKKVNPNVEVNAYNSTEAGLSYSGHSTIINDLHGDKSIAMVDRPSNLQNDSAYTEELEAKESMSESNAHVKF